MKYFFIRSAINLLYTSLFIFASIITSCKVSKQKNFELKDGFSGEVTSSLNRTMGFKLEVENNQGKLRFVTCWGGKSPNNEAYSVEAFNAANFSQDEPQEYRHIVSAVNGRRTVGGCESRFLGTYEEFLEKFDSFDFNRYMAKEKTIEDFDEAIGLVIGGGALVVALAACPITGGVTCSIALGAGIGAQGAGVAIIAAELFKDYEPLDETDLGKAKAIIRRKFPNPPANIVMEVNEQKPENHIMYLASNNYEVLNDMYIAIFDQN